MVQQLGELAEQLKNEAKPVDALRRWLRSNVEFVATKRHVGRAGACRAKLVGTPRLLRSIA
jgi:hypothetical protein